MVSDALIQKALLHLIYRKKSGALFSLQYNQYLNQLKSAASYLGLPASLTTHSARIGGALHRFANGIDANTVALHGRWECGKSLKLYIKNDRSFLQRNKLTPSAQANVDKYSLFGILYFSNLQ